MPDASGSTQKGFKSVAKSHARLSIALVVVAILFAVILKGVSARQAPPLKEVTLDFAFYNPCSIVLKKNGWLEADLKEQGTEVKWVESAGSNRALEYLSGNSTLEYLNGESVQFGSTAGLAAVLARANGSKIKAIYVYSRPEWTALVVGKDSMIKSVADLRGKKIAATKGTDPYLFLIRTLNKFGINRSEVEIVNMQHADGRLALEQERVDAWAGLDPQMARSQLLSGSRLLYRNVSFNTYGFLNVTESFAAEHPGIVKVVLKNYERARKWIIANPGDAAQLLADEAKIPLDVAKLQLQRTDFSNPIIGREHIDALNAAAEFLREAGLVQSGTDVSKAITDLIDPSFIHAVVSN